MQLVIAAITTWPWSTRVSVPSASTTGTLLSMCSASRAAAISAACRASVACSGGRMFARPVYVGGSEAGNESASNSIVAPSSCSAASAFGRKSSTAMRNAACASLSATRSCGRFGPASDGTTSPRSSAIVSE